MVLAEFALVLMRYVLGVGSIWLQESVVYAHAALFMLAAAWTLAADGHVRVDIFYADASARTKTRRSSAMPSSMSSSGMCARPISRPGAAFDSSTIQSL